VTLHNLSTEPVTVRLGIDATLEEVFGPRAPAQPPDETEGGRISLPAHGYRWFRVV
jgi:hypothetical protein